MTSTLLSYWVYWILLWQNDSSSSQCNTSTLRYLQWLHDYCLLGWIVAFSKHGLKSLTAVFKKLLPWKSQIHNFLIYILTEQKVFSLKVLHKPFNLSGSFLKGIMFEHWLARNYFFKHMMSNMNRIWIHSIKANQAIRFTLSILQVIRELEKW